MRARAALKRDRVRVVSPGDQKNTSESKRVPFPIVAIGASAGGLDAFTQLLRALPVDLGTLWQRLATLSTF